MSPKLIHYHTDHSSFHHLSVVKNQLTISPIIFYLVNLDPAFHIVKIVLYLHFVSQYVFYPRINNKITIFSNKHLTSMLNHSVLWTEPWNISLETSSRQMLIQELRLSCHFHNSLKYTNSDDVHAYVDSDSFPEIIHLDKVEFIWNQEILWNYHLMSEVSVCPQWSFCYPFQFAKLCSSLCFTLWVIIISLSWTPSLVLLHWK